MIVIVILSLCIVVSNDASFLHTFYTIIFIIQFMYGVSFILETFRYPIFFIHTLTNFIKNCYHRNGKLDFSPLIKGHR